MEDKLQAFVEQEYEIRWKTEDNHPPSFTWTQNKRDDIHYFTDYPVGARSRTSENVPFRVPSTTRGVIKPRMVTDIHIFVTFKKNYLLKITEKLDMILMCFLYLAKKTNNEAQ